MPDRMVIGDFFPEIKYNPEAVRKASCKQPIKTIFRNVRNERSKSDYNQPAHQQIDDSGDNAKSMNEKQFEDNSGNGKPPNYSKNSPTPRAPYHDQQKRGVCTCNQKVNGRVVKNFQVVLGTF